MGKLVAVIDGLPGSGKGYVCNMFKAAGYIIADLDDFTQKQLAVPKASSSCKGFKTVFGSVADQIHRFVKKQKGDVVLCGVSSMLFDTTGKCAVPVHKCTGACHRIWLEVAPGRGYQLHKKLAARIKAHPKLRRLSKTIVMDLVESTRRAVVREFRAKEVGEWRGMTRAERVDEGVFWALPLPGAKNGPKGIGRKGIDGQSVVDLITMDLNNFISKYYAYVVAMLQVQAEDGVHLNRVRALKNGFKPMRLERMTKEFHL